MKVKKKGWLAVRTQADVVCSSRQGETMRPLSFFLPLTSPEVHSRGQSDDVTRFSGQVTKQLAQPKGGPLAHTHS